MMFDDMEFDEDDHGAPSGAPPTLAGTPATPPASTDAPAPPMPNPIDAALQVVEILHPHVKQGAVTPHAALLSLALGLTRNWFK